LAHRGIVAIAIDYRLATNGLGINDCLVDCRDALLWIARHAQELAIDPTRLANMG
jgi:acetyl esterase/lipase